MYPAGSSVPELTSQEISGLRSPRSFFKACGVIPNASAPMHLHFLFPAVPIHLHLHVYHAVSMHLHIIFSAASMRLPTFGRGHLEKTTS